MAVSERVQKIVEQLNGLNVLEIAELSKALQEAWGVSAAAPVAMGVAGPTGAVLDAPPEVPEEQTEFNVILKEFGANKVNVIKAVRELTSLGLKEAKDLVEGAPKTVKEAVPKAEAEAAKARLEAAGATATIE